MTKEVELALEAYKEELKAEGLHHASNEFKEKVSAKEAELKSVGGKQPQSQAKEKEDTLDPLDFEVDPDKTYEFRMKKTRKGLKNLPRESVCWDEKEGRPREIRYCKTETSPYLEDQSEYSKPSHIAAVWKNGVLKVPGTNEALIRFLLAYDGFEPKKQVMRNNLHIRGEYYLYDGEKEAKAERNRKQLELDAQKVVNEADEEKLAYFMRSNFNVRTSGDALFARAFELAKQNPLDFVKNFNNPIHKLRVDMATLFEQGILEERNGRIAWTSSNSQVHTYNPASTKANAVEVLAKWILSGAKEAKEFQEIAYAKLQG